LIQKILIQSLIKKINNNDITGKEYGKSFKKC
jgi:hypothetical protein